MSDLVLEQAVTDFQNAEQGDQETRLQAALVGADPKMIKAALGTPAVKDNIGTVTLNGFPGIDEAARLRLYQTILWMLAGLAFAGLVGGTVALVAGKESAAFFTFAGLALGGITGILVPSPASPGTTA